MASSAYRSILASEKRAAYDSWGGSEDVPATSKVYADILIAEWTGYVNSAVPNLDAGYSRDLLLGNLGSVVVPEGIVTLETDGLWHALENIAANLDAYYPVVAGTGIYGTKPDVPGLVNNVLNVGKTTLTVIVGLVALVVYLKLKN